MLGAPEDQVLIRVFLGGACQAELVDLADEQLGLAVSVVLDAVFPLGPFRATARAIAARHHARFRAIYCYCSDDAIWQARLVARVQYVPGWTPVGWAEVERLRAIYTPWSPSAALGIDAIQPFEQNLARVLAYIRNPAP